MNSEEDGKYRFTRDYKRLTPTSPTEVEKYDPLSDIKDDLRHKRDQGRQAEHVLGAIKEIEQANQKQKERGGGFWFLIIAFALGCWFGYSRGYEQGVKDSLPNLRPSVEQLR